MSKHKIEEETCKGSFDMTLPVSMQSVCDICGLSMANHPWFNKFVANNLSQGDHNER